MRGLLEKGEDGLDRGVYKSAKRIFLKVIRILEPYRSDTESSYIELLGLAEDGLKRAEGRIIRENKDKRYAMLYPDGNPPGLDRYFNEEKRLDLEDQRALSERIIRNDKAALKEFVTNYIWMVKEEAKSFIYPKTNGYFFKGDSYYDDLVHDGIIDLYIIVKKWCFESEHNKDLEFEEYTRNYIRSSLRKHYNSKYYSLLYGKTLEIKENVSLLEIVDSEYLEEDEMENRFSVIIDTWNTWANLARVWGRQFGVRFHELSIDDKIIIWALQNKKASLDNLVKVLYYPVKKDGEANYILQRFGEIKPLLYESRGSRLNELNTTLEFVGQSL
jgi:hypothetical protein